MLDQFLTELWGAAKQAGPFASMLLLIILYFVNGERREVQRENRALHEKNSALVERLLTGLNEVNATLRSLAELFRAGRK